MKNQFLTIVIFFSLMGTCIGQAKTDISWGSALKVSKRSTLSDIVAYDPSGFYAIKTETRSYGIGILSITKQIITLEHYNNKLNPDRSSELLLEYNGNKLDYEQIIQLGDQLYVFSSYKDQSEKMNKIYVQSINKNTLRPNQDFRKVGEVSYEGNMKGNAGDFNLRMSRDSSKVLIYCNLPYEKHENEKFAFYVFDSKLDIIWDRQATLPYKEGLFEIADYKVDNQGNVHVLGTVFKEKRKTKRRGEPNYNYEVLSYFRKGNSEKSYTIKLEDKFLTDMQIAINDDMDIICSGFYSNAGTFSIVGTYFLKVNSKTKEITTKNFKEFGLDFITQNMTDRQEERTTKRAEKGKDVELYQYDLDDIIIRDDGGAVLLGEQYYVQVTTTTLSSGAQVTNYTYYYNDIVVINISPQGEIEWAKKIAKSQITSNDNGHFSSYTMAVVKDKMYFVFNDHPKNLGADGASAYAYRGGKKSTVVLVEVDSEGNLTKTPLFDTKNAAVITRPKVCEQVTDNSLILFGQKGKQHQFARITF